MEIQSIVINRFKSILDLEFQPGLVNVLIGANGVGKSALLEALGVMSAAISERVDDSTLQYRGVRVGTPALFKSSFKDQQRIPLTIEMAVKWTNDAGAWNYKVNLSNPIENPEPAWSYHSEFLAHDNEKIISRGRRSAKVNDLEIDKYRGLFSFSRGTSLVKPAEDLFDAISQYGIFTPNTPTLRGIYPDPIQRNPVGLNGGRLEGIVQDLYDKSNATFGTIDFDELLDLLDWVGDINVGRPTKDILSPSVPASQKTIRFTDRFMSNKESKVIRNQLTSYDASEGALYVLFLLSIAMHKSSPRIFAIDNFDQAMNPRLARATTSIFCREIIRHNKIAFITTHNPLVLDGLDLTDDRIRLFTLDRNKYGHTKITRVQLSEEFLRKEDPLSRLWITGRLGGVPKI